MAMLFPSDPPPPRPHCRRADLRVEVLSMAEGVPVLLRCEACREAYPHPAAAPAEAAAAMEGWRHHLAGMERMRRQAEAIMRREVPEPRRTTTGRTALFARAIAAPASGP